MNETQNIIPLNPQPVTFNFGKEAYEDLYDESNSKLLGIDLNLYTITHKKTQEICAAKHIKSIQSNFIDDIWTEIQAIVKLKGKTHPNIIQYYNVFFYQEKIRGSTMQSCIIVMQLGQYTLDKFSLKGQKVEENLIKKYLRECLEGFKFLEEQQIIHRDYKPANMCVSAENTLKLIDFDIARISQLAKTQLVSDNIGTPLYMDPNLKNPKFQENDKFKINLQKCDLFSIGLTFFQLILGLTTQQLRDLQFQFKEFLEKKNEEILADFLQYCEQIQDEKLRIVFKNMLEIDIQKRFSLEEVLNFLDNSTRPQRKLENPKLLRKIPSFKKNLPLFSMKQKKKPILTQIQQPVKNKKIKFNDLNTFENEVFKVAGQNYKDFKELHLIFDYYLNLQKQKVLCDGLQKMESLTVFYLWYMDNGINGQILGKSLQNLTNLKTLKMFLLLESDTSSDDQMKALTEFFQKQENLENFYLRLKDKNLTQNGLKFLGQSLKNQKKIKILSLQLEYEKQLNYGIEIGNILSQLPQLETLKIIQPFSRINTEDCSSIISSMEKLGNLQELDLHLSNNPLDLSGMAYIFSGLKGLRKLKRLTLILGFNGVNELSLGLLCGALILLQNLQKLNLYLYNNAIQDIGVKDLVESLQQLPNLEDLDLKIQDNPIGLRGAQALENGLKKIPKLKNLTLTVLQEFSDIKFTFPEKKYHFETHFKNVVFHSNKI